MGGVKNDQPLQGVEDNPLMPIPIEELPGFNNLPSEERNFGYTVLQYDLDNECCGIEAEASETFHQWLSNAIANIDAVVKTKGWKLDRSQEVE